MQIRVQGKKVQLIRSPYDPDKKRCVQKVVTTFPKCLVGQSASADKALTADQMALLSDDEIAHLSDWLKVRADNLSADRRSASVTLIAHYVRSSADAIDADGVSAQRAGEIWDAIERLSKSLKRAGHPRSAFKAPKAAPAVPPGQAALGLDE